MLIAAALLIAATLLIATALLGIVAIVVTGSIASLLSTTRLKSTAEPLGSETCFIVVSFAAVGSLRMNAGPLRPTATLVT